ncbi:hypothetical protein P3T76_001316 [Phytophthora citrophthora]|uniref:RxLR effector protein n=1 Tax=Phytophthora citrophthora TaxID=4793 RepID=A0AAD9GZ66_9STRA|nr:hypothetical protein P3T76_001316 [Phytophthora citrophthora]
MRLTYILAITVVATIHTSAAASPSADSKPAIENGAVDPVVASTFAEGGQMLRRVEDDFDDDKRNNGDDDDDDDDSDGDFDEERGVTDVVKKLNPITAVKKSAKKTAEKSAKIKEALKDAADYQKMIDRAKEMVSHH